MIRLLALVLCAAAGAAAQDTVCEVRGVTSLERLRVRVPDDRLRTLEAIDLPVAVRPGRGERYRDVQVLAPLAFGARTDDDVPFFLREDGPVEGGVLWLTARTTLTMVEERSGAVRIEAELAPGVTASRLDVPCEALTIGPGEGARPAPRWVPLRGPRWVPARRRLWLMAAPGDGEAVRIRLARGARLPRPLVEVERREPWIRVATTFPGTGAAVRGWVQAHHLRAAGAWEDPPREPRSYPARIYPPCSYPPRPDEYVGLAQVTPGTLVRTRPHGQGWATVSEATLFTVAWRVGESWARIVHVPGLMDEGDCPIVLGGAWVPRRAVALRGETADPSLLLLQP
jgi:hypothetical protein